MAKYRVTYVSALDGRASSKTFKTQAAAQAIYSDIVDRPNGFTYAQLADVSGFVAKLIARWHADDSMA